MAQGDSQTRQKLDRMALEEIIFRRAPMRRYTQDSPVLPDVWFAYGANPGEQIDLLLTPHRTSSPGEVFKFVRERLESERETEYWEARHGEEGLAADLAYSQSAVAGRFYFDELVRVLLPLAVWERSSSGSSELRAGGKRKRPPTPRPLGTQWIGLQRLGPKGRTELAEDLIALEGGHALHVAPELVWMVRIVGTLQAAHDGTLVEPPSPEEEAGLRQQQARAIVDAVVGLLKGAPAAKVPGRVIFSISRNREASVAVWRSVEAVKADAATRLFNLSCTDLKWAILDSGIDATHQALRLRDHNEKKYGAAFQKDGTTWQNRTRVVATYDFTRIRELLDPDRLAQGTYGPALAARLQESEDRDVQDLVLHLQSGRYVDWDLFAPLLEVPHDDRYTPPEHDHGTHVAGILAGDWLAKESNGVIDHDLIGVCRDIQLYDIRVLDKDGRGDEFSIIAGLQFVRHLNAHKDEVVVHGVNLSLSIPHDVANYACGRTPVCDECDRLVAAGVVMVVAAGNEGYIEYLTSAGPTEGYRNISITDPGNAESVITVGATHRYRPFTYGVSYFSSRGPTGDGRMKPDLVAPGEKIWSAVPKDNVRALDGTSMAAPHVSGCAALLMARHRELVGQPARVKQILSETCTDLGRERYFQGNGMVDVLRAIQSV
ncbi:MAG TPA: S8 family peptidase [Actinomycetota bacterium]|jgi:subtilisin family serine protease